MIKVASYNIRKGIGADRRRNPDRILDVLREVDADIVALQEADRRFGEREGVLPLHLIEVQSGAYLGEDDIVRIADNYGRA